MVAESVEAIAPALVLGVEPFDGGRDGVELGMTGTLPAVSPLRHQAGVLEDLQMTRHRLQAHLVWCREFVDRGVALRQSLEQRASGGVGKGSEGRTECVDGHAEPPMIN